VLGRGRLDEDIRAAPTRKLQGNAITDSGIANWGIRQSTAIVRSAGRGHQSPPSKTLDRIMLGIRCVEVETPFHVSRRAGLAAQGTQLDA
jgi:hypothetical protein